MSSIIISNVLSNVVAAAVTAIANKASGVNYRSHINPEEMK